MNQANGIKPSVYVETTAVSYLVSKPSRDLVVAAHQQVTREWWERRGAGFDLYASQVVVEEASAGDQAAARKRLDVLGVLLLLEINPEVVELARALTRRGPIPESSPADALHVAVATVHGMDFLLTWNCAHIANAEMRRGLSQVCGSEGYETPLICTPEELMGETYVQR